MCSLCVCVYIDGVIVNIPTMFPGDPFNAMALDTPTCRVRFMDFTFDFYRFLGIGVVRTHSIWSAVGKSSRNGPVFF